MQGFEDSRNPVMLLLEVASDLGPGPFAIDGAKAQLTDAGVRADVNGVRHFVPMRYIRRVWQDQTPAPAPVLPIVSVPSGQGGTPPPPPAV